MRKLLITIAVLSLCVPLSAQEPTGKDALLTAKPEDIDLKKLDDVVQHTAQTGRPTGSAQQVTGFRRNDHGLWLQTTGGTLLLEPLRDGCLHVAYGTEVRLTARQSLVVGKKPSQADYAVDEQSASVTLTTDNYRAVVDKQHGNLTIYDADGRRLVGEYPSEARLNLSGDSVCPYVKFQLAPTDALYGLGEFRDSYLNLRGKQRELVQFNTQAAVPVVYSTGGWGLLWDNGSRTTFDDSEHGMSLLSDYGDVVDYYLFIGESLDQLVGRYRALTGTAPMLPRWSLGYHQSRNRYHDWKELFGVAQKMKETGLTMSSVFIDYHYWGRYGTGSMRFDEATFPNPRIMIDSLHKAYGTKVVVTMWPCFKPGTENYRLMSALGYILEGSRAIDGYVYDVFNPAARAQYRQLVKPMLALPIDGWFLDGPEPDHIPTFLPTMTWMGSAHRVRNLYPLLHAANFYQAITEERPNERPYMLTRCAFAGQQRYGTAVWSGDIPTTFDELRKQVVAGLSFTATGIPYWTTDIGGYSGGDPSSDDYRELFARWFQYGTFCPIFRAHGRREPFDTTGPNELWAYGERVQTICKDYIDLRYRYMPYIYSLSGAVTQHHYTPMRLLAFDFAEDANCRDCKTQFMYGPAWLVCPVLQAGANEREVYLPAGCRWTDFWSGQTYDGGQTITAQAPLERMPLYVRSGSIVPNTESVDVYGGADAHFDLYEDDGETLNYEKGDFQTIKLDWDDVHRWLTIGACPTAKPRRISVRLMGTGEVKEVSYKGKRLTVKFGK